MSLKSERTDLIGLVASREMINKARDLAVSWAAEPGSMGWRGQLELRGKGT